MIDYVGEAIDKLITIEAKNHGMPHGILQPMYDAARKVAQHNVTINGLLPGQHLTERMHSGLVDIERKTGRSREDALSAMLKDNPQKRLVKPQEVAAAVLYLCSPEADSVTGTALVVAGGEI